MFHPRVHRAATVIAAALTLALGARPAQAQLGRLKDLAKKAAEKTPDVSGLLQGSPPITSNIEDARFAVDSLDNFKPREAMRSLLTLQRTPNGGFTLSPGYYGMEAQSYCLHAGTYGPGGGDGYLYTPTLGPADDPVMTIVRNSVNHPEIDQHDVQVLLWAIIARSKFEDLPSQMKLTATRLLSPEMLVGLNRSALDLFPDAVLNAAYAKVPAPLRSIIEAEAKLRKMLINPATSFGELERVAVLAGLAPEQGDKVPSGRWS